MTAVRPSRDSGFNLIMCTCVNIIMKSIWTLISVAHCCAYRDLKLLSWAFSCLIDQKWKSAALSSVNRFLHLFCICFSLKFAFPLFFGHCFEFLFTFISFIMCFPFIFPFILFHCRWTLISVSFGFLFHVFWDSLSLLYWVFTDLVSIHFRAWTRLLYEQQ